MNNQMIQYTNDTNIDSLNYFDHLFVGFVDLSDL